MRRFSLVLAMALLGAPSVMTMPAGRARDTSGPRAARPCAKAAATGRFELTVDSLMCVDAGDIVMGDSSGARRQIARTTGGGSTPRWARNDSQKLVRDEEAGLIGRVREERERLRLPGNGKAAD